MSCCLGLPPRAIPLSMLFTLGPRMAQKNTSANLMSLRVHSMFWHHCRWCCWWIVGSQTSARFAHTRRTARTTSPQSERFRKFSGCRQTRASSVWISLLFWWIVFADFALSGVEAKMFHPIALAVVLSPLLQHYFIDHLVPAAGHCGSKRAIFKKKIVGCYG